MSRDTRKVQITHLLGNPALTHEDIARTVGCSTKTVQRVAREIKPDVEEAIAKLEEYQTLLNKHLPIKNRVEIYTQIAKKADSNPYAAMKALERADELDGILTAKDEIKRPSQESAEHRPMFILPPGTAISVSVKPYEPVQSKEIDVTPKRNS
jgi:transcriptional antiterminator